MFPRELLRSFDAELPRRRLRASQPGLRLSSRHRTINPLTPGATISGTDEPLHQALAGVPADMASIIADQAALLLLKTIRLFPLSFSLQSDADTAPGLFSVTFPTVAPTL